MELIQHHQCGPMEWLGVFIPDDGLCVFKGLAFVPLALFGCELLIECSHEFCSHIVADTPRGQRDRSLSRLVQNSF